MNKRRRLEPSSPWLLGDRPWAVACAVALCALWFAARNAPFGVAVADDYAFLDRLAFQRPLSLFDSMGATYYWRPLSRQLYFTLLGPQLIEHPWLVPAVHSLLLVLLSWLVFRIVHRVVRAPLVATAVSVFPIASESARVLLAWPSAAQHLLAMVFAILAIHEILAGRWFTSALAAGLGLLSHESSAIVLPLIPAIAWWSAPDAKERARAALRAGTAIAVVAGAWLAGYAIARSHGVVLPPGGGPLLPRVPDLFAKAVPAALNLEDAPAGLKTMLWTGYFAMAVLACVMLWRKKPRTGRRVLWIGLAWFVVGSIPLALLLPDWNAWRDSLPSLGLGFAATAALGLAAPWVAAAFACLRLVALLLAAPVAPSVASYPPMTTSDMSFIRIARLQRIADGTRRALQKERGIVLPDHQVRFLSIPRMAEVAFHGPMALRVWLGDSTLTFTRLGSMQGLKETNGPVVIYDAGERGWQVVVLEPEAIRLLARGVDALNHDRYPEASSLLMASRRAQPAYSGEFDATVTANLARVAYWQGETARADSFNEQAGRLGGLTADYWALRSAVELRSGQLREADQHSVQSLQMDPRNSLAAAVRATLAANVPPRTP